MIMMAIRLLEEGRLPRPSDSHNDNCWVFVVILWKEITAAYGSDNSVKSIKKAVLNTSP